MSKTKRGQANTCQRAQQRNWAWCRISNANGQLKALAHDRENVLLAEEKAVIVQAQNILQNFLDVADNGTNWERKKAILAELERKKEQAEEF